MTDMINLKDESPEQIKKIFDLVIQNEISEYSTPSEIRKVAKEFISENSVNVSDIQEFSFYDFDNFKETKKDEKLFRLMCTCARFKFEVLTILVGKNNKLKPIKLVRQVSPPLEAYKYIPFNKMDIKNSGRSYGLLFE